MKDEIKEIKIGMYTTDEILEFMTNGEGRGFMGRSMYDAIIDYITNLQEEKDSIDDYARHLHNENKALQEENGRLKEENNKYKEKKMILKEIVATYEIDKSNEDKFIEDLKRILWDEDEDIRLISVIQGHGTYGENKDLLEIQGCLTSRESKEDSVKGYLTAKEVFKRIKKNYFKEQE